MAQIVAPLFTTQFASGAQDRIIRSIDAEIGMLEPNEAALTSLLMELNMREGVGTQKFEWIEDDFVSRYGVADGTGADNQLTTTSLGVVDGTVFQAGDVVLVPQVVTSSTAPEEFLVVSVSTNTLTIKRALRGDSTVQAIPANSPLFVIGSAAEEGADRSSMKTTIPVTKVGYTQIFKTSLDISESARASVLYGAPNGEYDREQVKKLREHKIKMNRAFMFGGPATAIAAGPGGKPLKMSAGLNGVISTNVYDAGGILTRKSIDDWAEVAFRYGSSDKLLFAGGTVVKALHSWARSQVQTSTDVTQWGVKITNIVTPFGVWRLVYDKSLENAGASTAGFKGWAISVDPQNVKYRFLEGNGVNRDTKLKQLSPEELQGADKSAFEYLTEGGLQVRQEKTHAKMFNVTDYVD